MPQFDISGAAAQAAGSIVGAGMGLALGGIERKNQIKQQQKLQNMQIAGQKEMGEYNYQKQLQMFQDTGYGAQMKQLKEAGLNPGLIYGMGGGAGGQTNVNTGNVSGGQARQGGEAAAMGMQMMGAALMQAQTENVKADTANKRAENPNIGLAGEETKGRIASLAQGVQESKAKQALINIEGDIAELNRQYLAGTMEDRIKLVETSLNKLEGEAAIVMNDKAISDATKLTKAAQIYAEYAGTLLENELTKTQTAATKQGIAESKQNVRQSQATIQNMKDMIYQRGAEISQKGYQISQDGEKILQEWKKIDWSQSGLPKWATDILEGVPGVILGGSKVVPSGGRAPIRGFKPGPTKL